MGIFSMFKKKDDAFPDLDSPSSFSAQDPFGAMQNPGINANSPLLQDNRLGLPPDPGLDFSTPEISNRPDLQRPPQLRPALSSAQPMGMNDFPQNSAQAPGWNKEFELLNAKLDGIRHALESLNQRMMRLERFAEESSQKSQIPKPQKKDIWSEAYQI